MARFVKWRKKVKEVIVIITIVMLLLSGIVKADTLESTTYNIFGVKEVTVIEGDRPEDKVGDTSVFYSNDPTWLISETLKITEEEFKNKSTQPDDFYIIDQIYNQFIIFNIDKDGVNYATIKDFFNGLSSDVDEFGYYIGLIKWSQQDHIAEQIADTGIDATISVTENRRNDQGDIVEETQETQETQETTEETQDSGGGGIFGFLGGILDGIVSVFMYILRLIPVTIATGLGKIISTIGALITGTNVAQGLTLDDILFNKVEITSIDFFSTSTDTTVNLIRDNVATWYVGIRNLSAIILSLILLYVGIRMAISSVAEDKAKYKKMLGDWITSIALLFVLHYIMEAVIAVNNSLVNIMANAGSTNIATGSKNFNDTMNQFIGAAYDFNVDTVTGIAYAFIYLLLSLITFIFLLTYIRRMVTIAFLIMIAPIITITYSIDKMGDGKSQALNAWMKEYIYNILIQPFHCIIYLALVNSSFEMLKGNSDAASNLGPAVLCFAIVMSMFKAEEIVKNIFNFKASSMPQAIAQGAMFATAINAIGGKGKSAASAVGKAGSAGRKAPKFANSQGKNQTGGTSKAEAGGTSKAEAGGTTPKTTEVKNPEEPYSQKLSGIDRVSTDENRQGQYSEKLGRMSQIFKDDGGEVKPPVTPVKKTKNGNGRAAARKIGGAVLRNTLKATGYAVGFTLGAATGNFNVAISGMQAIGRSTSGAINGKHVSSQQRNLAKAYNNFENEHSELDEKSKIAYSRKLLDHEIEAQTDAEREYVRAMTEMNNTYERGGLSSDEAGDKVEKTIKKIQEGEISELSAPQRYYRQARNAFTQRNNENGSDGQNTTTV